jgi:uncharacterized protein YuzE
MTVKFGGIEFDNVFYDQDADVLYMHIGATSTAVDWDESPEGHHLRYGSDGGLVGITIVNAKRILDEDGKIVVTLPEHQIEASDLEGVLTPA